MLFAGIVGCNIGREKPGPAVWVHEDPDAALDDGVTSGEEQCDMTVADTDFAMTPEWSFHGQGDERAALSVPAIADVTGDGTPDIIAVLYTPGGYFETGHIYLLDGRTGALHRRFEEPVAPTTHPAVGDIDGDGELEIVAFGPSVTGRLLAFEADGSLMWKGEAEFPGGQYAIGLADMDTDGDVEIYAGGHLADHLGREIFDTGTLGIFGMQASTAADLDGDGDLELVVGAVAHHHDGTLYYDHTDRFSYGHPQVADLDGDLLPEILVTTPEGPWLIEHDGELVPFSTTCNWAWMPTSVGDFDDDGESEIAGLGHRALCVSEPDLGVRWDHCVRDDGYAAVTAYDLTGNGRAEVLYGDNHHLLVFDDRGRLLFKTDRASVTQIDFPVVVDADADGAAEIIVVANAGYAEQEQPAIQLWGSDAEEWSKAPQIWNQHTYHGTNVNADGTIPTTEEPHWLTHNSFRMQIQEGD